MTKSIRLPDRLLRVENVLIILSLLAIGYAFGLERQAMPHRAESPIGCDPFGYLRQAQLFRKEGLGGFDTRLSGPMPEVLLDIAKADPAKTANFAEAIAPHCHHLDERTGRIILQYPPGTGLLLALFPAGQQARSLDMLLISLVAAAAAAYALTSTSLGQAFGAGLAGTATLLLLRSQSVSWSVAPSVVLAMAAAWLTIAAFRAEDAHRRLALSAVLGLAVGLSINFRIPNALLGAGILASYAAVFMRRPTTAGFLHGCTVVAGMVAGAAPTLVSNTLNAGAPWATTYGPVDASAPRVDLELLGQNVVYYFSLGWQSYVLVGGALAVIGAVLCRKRLPESLRLAVPVAIAVNYVLNVAFFLTHAPRTPYYLVPAAIWTVYAGLLAFAAGARRPEPWRWGLAAFAVLIVLAAGLKTKIPRNDPALAAGINVSVPPKAMVWADVSTGLFVMHMKQYAAKLQFTDEATRDLLVKTLAERGIAQFFVNDSEYMKAIIAHVGAARPLVRAGTAFGYDVYQLSM